MVCSSHWKLQLSIFYIQNGQLLFELWSPKSTLLIIYNHHISVYVKYLYSKLEGMKICFLFIIKLSDYVFAGKIIKPMNLVAFISYSLKMYWFETFISEWYTYVIVVEMQIMYSNFTRFFFLWIKILKIKMWMLVVKLKSNIRF